jgi:type 2 lantibiotic biosynthesis protein LanM
MKERVSTSLADVAQRQHHVAWYRAMTLTERTALLKEHSSAQSPLFPADDEGARQRLQHWKGQLPFNKDGYFEQRLAQDGLTEDDLLALLAGSSEAPRTHISTLPSWLQTLMNAFESLQSEQDANVMLSLLQTERDLDVAAYLVTLRPLIKDSVTRLQAGLHALSQKYPYLPFDPVAMLPLLVKHLPARLLPRLIRTCVLELNVARVEGRLEGETPQERFRYFLQQLCQLEGILPLLEEYSVLARRLVESLERWVICELELLEHLCADWEEICATFPQARDAGELVEVQEGRGDTHRRGRSVTILVWKSGFRLVYKPRSMAVDLHFQELLSWMNAMGYRPAFRTCRIIDKPTYGWAEFIQEGSCASREELERFYQRQGGYLALLYALEASDFHAQNLIASGEHPMLIDLEGLFQPRKSREAVEKEQIYPGLETINHSVLRIGLLPRRMWSNDQSGGIDDSGLGGQAEQLTPMAVPRLTEAEIDQMKFSSERVPLPSSQHRPRLHDQDIDTLEYRDCVISGFTSAYRLLMAHRDELLQEILPRFADDEVRCVLRPTRTYSKLLTDSFHPNVLRDALDCDCLFDRLWISVEQQPHLASVIAAERADLWADDIPVFTTYPGSQDIFTSTGERIADFLAIPSLEVVRRRIRNFCEQNMEKQVWIIRGSFSSIKEKYEYKEAEKQGLQLHPSQTAVSRDRLIAVARTLGDRLERLAEYYDGKVGWLNVSLVNEGGWNLLPTGPDLYGGLSGLTFFLSYLGMLTGEQRYTALAQAALNTTRCQIGRRKRYPGLGGIGVFNGIGSFIYLLSHLGTLWNDPALYQEAEELVQLLPDAIAQDQIFDVIGGAAGCIAALLSLYAVAPSQAILAAACQCGDHLITSARPLAVGIGWSNKFAETPLAGFAHGNAGIALFLLQLFALSGEERFRQAALQAIAYEDSLFSPERQNWPDLRRSPVSQVEGDRSATHEKLPYMVAWCHGAPGIGLARLGSLSVLHDAKVHAEIDAALETTIKRGFGMNHSLCHGDMGNLDILLTATQLLANERYKEELQRIAPMLLDSIETQSWISGVPQGVETPGLMVGLAGMGYALLRLAESERIPSVLLLAPPSR